MAVGFCSGERETNGVSFDEEVYGDIGKISMVHGCCMGMALHLAVGV